MTHIWKRSADQARAAKRPLGDIALLVLTKQPSAPAAGESVGLRRKQNRVLNAQHDETVALSSRGRRRMVEGSGHNIQLDQPAIVIEAVRLMLSFQFQP